jgi:hypothetical protein
MSGAATGGYPSDWDERRHAVYQRDDHTCQTCGADAEADGVTLHAHHIVPKSEGGSHKLSNLTTLCAACHNRAHDHHIPHGEEESTPPTPRDVRKQYIDGEMDESAFETAIERSIDFHGARGDGGPSSTDDGDDVLSDPSVVGRAAIAVVATCAAFLFLAAVNGPMPRAQATFIGTGVLLTPLLGLWYIVNG